MHDRIDFMTLEALFQIRPVARIAFDEFTPFDKPPMPVNQAVDGYRVKPLLGERFAAMGADIPGTAGH
jgi:hypothetical protein